VENTTSDVIAAGKSSDQIEQDMERTRESISEKVVALETQVLGTIQTATDTVTDTVDAVKEAVSSAKEAVTTAPTAIRDSVREVVDSVKESVGSFSASECVRRYPAAALGSSAFAGFLAGYLFGGARRKPLAQSSFFATHEPRTTPPVSAPAAPARSPGLLGEVFDRLGSEVRQLVEQAMSTGIAALKESLEKRLPVVVDSAVERVTGPADPHTNGASHRNGVRAPA